MGRTTTRGRLAQLAASPTVEAAVPAFVNALLAAGKSPKTVTSYEGALVLFTTAFPETRIDAITADHANRFLIQLRLTQKPASVQNRYAGLRAFLRWALESGLIADLPLKGVKTPTVPEREPRGFTPEELRAMLGVCNTRTLRGARDAAVVYTLVATALRASELLQLRREDLARENGVNLLRVIGKGNKERVVALDQEARAAIDLYLLRRGDDDEPALWIGQRGPLSLHGLYDLVRALGAESGVEHAHPHRFRNTALSAMLDAGMAAQEVMRISGHKRLEMLQHYTAWSEARRANTALLDAHHLQRLGLKRKR